MICVAGAGRLQKQRICYYDDTVVTVQLVDIMSTS